ncbi:MAG: hypothetical protein ACFFCW_01880 [Candidatus Hodarchaeota archaeon]
MMKPCFGHVSRMILRESGLQQRRVRGSTREADKDCYLDPDYLVANPISGDTMLRPLVLHPNKTIKLLPSDWEDSHGKH